MLSRYSKPQLKAKLEVYLQQFSLVGQIRQLISTSNFININGEDALIEPKASILQKVIKALIITLYNAPDNKENNKEVKLQIIKLNKALNVLEYLKLYKGQQEDSNKTLIIALIKAEKTI